MFCAVDEKTRKERGRKSGQSRGLRQIRGRPITAYIYTEHASATSENKREALSLYPEASLRGFSMEISPISTNLFIASRRVNKKIRQRSRRREHRTHT
jgi:hypothetical protein